MTTGQKYVHTIDLDARALLLHGGKQDVRRGHLTALDQWYSALSKRKYEPATVVFHGDSVTNGFGSTAKALTFPQLFREAIQREYRYGGAGFIPITANNSPWILANGISDGGASDVFGIGRKSYWMDQTTETATYTFVGDRFWLYFTSGPGVGTASITVDGVAVTFNTNAAANGVVKWDSSVHSISVNGLLPQTAAGNVHTVVVRPNAASNLIVLHGAHVFNGDYGKGVHVVEAGHDGYHAGHYNNSAVTTQFIDHFIAMQTPLVRPDLVVIEFGFNEQGSTVPAATYKTNLKQLIGQYRTNCTPVPSFVIMGIWARGDAAWTDADWQPFREAQREVAAEENAAFFDLYDLGGYIGTQENAAFPDVVLTNASAVITSATAQFRSHDVGKVVAGTGIPGGATIASVQSVTQATLSANATSSITTTMVIFARKDPQQLTTDLLHPSDRGYQWIADELKRLTAGMPEQATIPGGIFDNPGEMIVASAADTPSKLDAPSEGQVPTGDPGATLGIRHMRVGMAGRLIQVAANQGAATFNIVGTAATETAVAGTLTSADQADGPHVNMATATTLNADGARSLAYNARSSWLPEYMWAGRLGGAAADIQNCRIFIGLTSATPMGSADPAVTAALFRFDTGASDTRFRTFTNDGSGGGTITDAGLASAAAATAAAVAAGKRLRLHIQFRNAGNVLGSVATEVWFFINGIPVAVHRTNLPAAATNMIPWWGIRNLSAGTARNLLTSRYAVGHP